MKYPDWMVNLKQNTVQTMAQFCYMIKFNHFSKQLRELIEREVNSISYLPNNCELGILPLHKTGSFSPFWNGLTETHESYLDTTKSQT